MQQLDGINGDGGQEENRRREIRAAAHELRTPLIAILGFAELLLQEGAGMDQNERDAMLASIVANAKAEEAVIVRWLEERYPESRNGHHKHRVISALVLRDETEELLTDIAAVLGRDRINVEIPAWLNILAEKGALREIMTNLLTNAVKYSPDDSPIEVTTAIGAENVTVTVHNSGTLAAPELDRIFDRGYRASRNGQSGHGLGLAIVRELVADLGGRVWAEDARGGTDLNFTLSRPTLAAVYPFVRFR